MENHTLGLTQQEALLKLREFGFNEIKDLSRTSPLKILLRLISKDFIIYLLATAAIISFFVGEAVTGYTILLVLLVIITTTFIQEYRAEKAIKALQGMIMQVSIAIRDGKEQEVLSKDLVPGDLILLRSGEKVPADCVVVEQRELRLNESVLTGESREIGKEATVDINNYTESNLVFMGSFVVNGRCKAVVLHTGMNTKFGNIAGLISETEKNLPLQDKVNHIAKYMVVAAITISILTGILMVTRAETLSTEAISGILVLVIALSVSAFPEGLPVVLVTSLAIGATRMAKKNAIVNRMSIIETLGETTVICADKTGTITTGEMTVKKIFTDDVMIDIEGAGYEAKGSFLLGNQKVELQNNDTLQLLLKSAMLCNDSRIARTGDDEEYKVSGTPTEGALAILSAKAHLFQEDMQFERIEEIPFNSQRKMMSVRCKNQESDYVFAKGALEILLEKCTHIRKNGRTILLTTSEKNHILEVNQHLTQNSFRTIAFAFRSMKDSSMREYEERGLVFLGIAGIDDPPREEVAESLRVCKQAGISVKVITGDNKETALAVVKAVGLTGGVLVGEELDRITDDELSKIINEITVFARVTPEHKLRIVRVLKQNGEIVTMTGDGVNDAPALKEAHIGVAMGKNGTDVSRAVADLTLKDDNFATIVEAIREGRTIFINIRKFVSYQLSCNWSELSILLLGVILAPFLGWEVPILLALQILFMNLITDDLPAITLGLNHSSTDVMTEKPRRNAKIINKEAFVFMVVTTVLVTFSTLLTFYITFNVLQKDVVIARTSAMVSLILLEIICAFSFRSFRFPVLTRSPFINIYLFWASIISIFATLIIVYTPLNDTFSVTPLKIGDWIIPVAFTFCTIFILDQFKNVKGFIMNIKLK